MTKREGSPCWIRGIMWALNRWYAWSLREYSLQYSLWQSLTVSCAGKITGVSVVSRTVTHAPPVKKRRRFSSNHSRHFMAMERRVCLKRMRGEMHGRLPLLDVVIAMNDSGVEKITTFEKGLRGQAFLFFKFHGIYNMVYWFHLL